MKAKHLIFGFQFFILSFATFAQSVGISEIVFTPHASSILEVRSTNKGILIPRVALTQTTSASPITSPEISLLIYNTETINDVTPGYYYWNGTRWIRLLNDGNVGAAWSLSGNSITGTEFIGTTNAQDFRVFTNNTERLRVTSGGNVGIGTTTPGGRLHVEGQTRIIHSTSPSVYIQNDANSFANLALEVFSQGSQRAFIASNGGAYFQNNVGIGTASPATRLHVDGTVRFVNLAAQAGETTALVIDASGNVKARALNSIAFTGYTETDPNAWRLIGNSGTNPATNFVGTTDNVDFVFRTNNSERLRITSGGNVGIGTTTPATQLHTTGTVRFANYASGANGALLRTDASGNLQITNFSGNASDVLLGNGTFGPAPGGGGLWTDAGSYIRPSASVDATYPFIYDDNSTNLMRIDYSGTNTENAIYVYSLQNTDGLSYGVAGTRANIKAYDYWGNNFNSAIAGYSYLDGAGSSGVLAARHDGYPRAELATRQETFPGSGSSALYSLKLSGDFWNQEIAYGQSTTPYLTGNNLRTVTITTHGTESAVWIHAEADYYKTGTGSYVGFHIYRNGVRICEVSEFSNMLEDKTVHIQWIDEPPAGTHTYELRFFIPSGEISWYGHQLHIFEIKK